MEAESAPEPAARQKPATPDDQTGSSGHDSGLEAQASPLPPRDQAALSGKRQAFDDVLVPLTEEDLASRGTQKVILYMLQQARNDADQFEGYVVRFHEADKRAVVLQEKLDSISRTHKAIDIAVLVGTTLGGAIMTTATYFWAKSPAEIGTGILAVAIGLVLLLGSISVRTTLR
jgi:hypothetical protein